MEWIFQLEPAYAASLQSVRHLADLTVAEGAGTIWLRALRSSDHPPAELMQLPLSKTFSLDQKDRLFPLGRTTPIGQLPELQWQPIAAYLPVELPVAALPGELGEGYAIRLVQATQEQESGALLTDLTAWADYCEGAVTARLSSLRFAVNAAQQVLIIGQLLPPLPGTSYWQRESLWLPSGYDLEYPILAPVLGKTLDPGGQGIILFSPAGTYEFLPEENLQRATRSAIRHTCKRVEGSE